MFWVFFCLDLVESRDSTLGWNDLLDTSPVAKQKSLLQMSAILKASCTRLPVPSSASKCDRCLLFVLLILCPHSLEFLSSYKTEQCLELG